MILNKIPCLTLCDIYVRIKKRSAYFTPRVSSSSEAKDLAADAQTEYGVGVRLASHKRRDGYKNSLLQRRRWRGYAVTDEENDFSIHKR